jgi:hypothetical protein
MRSQPRRAYARQLAATQLNLCDMTPLSRSLSGRMSVGVQKRSDEVNRDPNGGLAVGPRRSGL